MKSSKSVGGSLAVLKPKGFAPAPGTNPTKVTPSTPTPSQKTAFNTFTKKAGK